MNKNIDALMSHDPFLGLTFDDVSLVTQYADFLPKDTCIKTRFSRNITLNIPCVSAAMDTVTNADMAIAMAKAGGIGVIHKNMDIEPEAAEVRKVKLHVNGLIESPVVFVEDQTIGELIDVKNEKGYPFSGW